MYVSYLRTGAEFGGKLTMQPSTYIRVHRLASFIFQTSLIRCDETVGTWFRDIPDVLVLEHAHGRNRKWPIANFFNLASRCLDVGSGQGRFQYWPLVYRLGRALRQSRDKLRGCEK